MDPRRGLAAVAARERQDPRHRQPRGDARGSHRDSICGCQETEREPRPTMKLSRRSRGDREVNSAGEWSRPHRDASPARPYPCRDWPGFHQGARRSACPSPPHAGHEPRPDKDQTMNTNANEKTTKTKKPNTKRPTKRSRRARARARTNRRAQSHGHPGRRAWRSAPATADQVEALRTIAEITGHSFDPTTITRGGAWKRIQLATSSIGPGLRSRCAPPWWTPAARRRP